MQTLTDMVAVEIPSALRSFCAGRAEVRLAARDVRGLLAEMQRRHPDIFRQICDERGQPRQHIGIFVNEDHIRDRNGLDTPLTGGDVVAILPAVSGG